MTVSRSPVSTRFDQTFTVVMSLSSTIRSGGSDLRRSRLPSAIRKIGEFTGFVPAGGEQTLVKRVIGVGGDHVTCQSTTGKVSVNGVEIDEPLHRERAGALR